MCNKIENQQDGRSSFILHPSAFTLVELMVSVAIVVILMVGVAQVFQMTSQAVGASQQLSDAVRNERAINSTMGPELAQIATDGPILMIRGQVQKAFRNRADNQADSDSDPVTWEQRATDLGIGSRVFPALPNERMHRIDRLGFMARGSFHRQTGNDGTFVDPMRSNEAFIWYGHLCLPHTTGIFYLNGDPSLDKTNPGTGNFSTNPQNYYSTQWILGHVVTTLIQPTGASAAPLNYGTIGTNTTQFTRRKWDNTSATYLAPLSEGSQAADGAYTQDCRYDLAGTSISGFASIMRGNLGSQWQEGVSYANLQRVYYRGCTYEARLAHPSSILNAPVPYATSTEWTYLDTVTDWWSDIFMQARYECNPFVVKPLTSARFSQQAPVFAQGCTQFIVEYAGDFLRQDTDPASLTYGYVLDSFDNPSAPPSGYQHTDGETDFIVTWTDTNGDKQINPTEASTIHRQVRWYGLPRDVNTLVDAVGTSRPGGDAKVRGFVAGVNPQDLIDVVPLRDVAMTIHTTANRTGAPWNTLPFSVNAGTFYNYSNGTLSYWGAPFERIFSQTGPGTPAYHALYMNATGDPGNTAGLQEGEFYQCAWGPYDTVRPRMIRITITLDDPLSRFAEGQTFEYVFKLP